MQIVFLGGNLHGMPNPVFLQKKSKCCLLKFLSSMQIINMIIHKVDFSACIKGSLGVRDSQNLPWDFQKSMPGSLGLLTFQDI